MSDDLEKIKAQMMQGPGFGNSAFQILHFTEHLTPERQYRHALLQLHQKLQALKTGEFARDRLLIDIDEIKEKLGKQPDWIAKRRLEVDKAEAEWKLAEQLKMVHDAEAEVEIYSRMLEKIGKPFTRLEFEHAEFGYWQQRLLHDARRELTCNSKVDVGTLRSLNEIGFQPQIVGGNRLVLIPFVAEAPALTNTAEPKLAVQ